MTSLEISLPCFLRCSVSRPRNFQKGSVFMSHYLDIAYLCWRSCIPYRDISFRLTIDFSHRNPADFNCEAIRGLPGIFESLNSSVLMDVFSAPQHRNRRCDHCLGCRICPPGHSIQLCRRYYCALLFGSLRGWIVSSHLTHNMVHSNS